MAKMSTFTDDFQLPGYDYSKWNLTTYRNGFSGGAYFFFTNLGLRFYASGFNGVTTDPTYMESQYTYDLTNSYAMFGDIYATSTISNNSVLLGVYSGGTQAVAPGTPGYQTGTAYSYYFNIYYSGTTCFIVATMLQAGAASAPTTTLGTMVYNPSTMKYLRISMSGTTLYWQYSADGSTWTQYASYVTSANMTASRPFLFGTHTNVNGSDYTGINRFNTTTNISRGTGIFYDDFSSLPQASFLANPIYGPPDTIQYGQWRTYSGTQPSIGQSPDSATPGKNALTSTTATNHIMVDNYKTATDQDITVSVRVSAGKTRIAFKSQLGNPGTNTYSWLEIDFTGQKVSIGNTINGTDQTALTPVTGAASQTISSTVTYTYRIVQVSTDVVVQRNAGPGSGAPVEISRWTNTNTSSGTWGIANIAGTSKVTLFQVKNATSLPAAPGSISPPTSTQVKPWVGTRTAANSNIEYMYLSDSFGNTLNLMPSYGDIIVRDFDFGTPSARSVVKQRPLGNGAYSTTRFHSDKAVHLTLTAYKTAYYEAEYYSVLVQRWAVPGKQSLLVYKPRGMPERYINIEGSSLGRAVMTAVSRQKIDLDVSFLAVDGGDYETVATIAATSTNNQIAVNTTSGLPTEPKVRFYGPCTAENLIIYNDTIEQGSSGSLARVGLSAITLASTEFVEVDMKERTVQFNGVQDPSAAYNQFLDPASFFVLIPGQNLIRLSSDGGSGTGQIEWKNKF